MGSGIQWTDKTWNPVVGCTPVSPGCLNCYAASMAVRLEGMGTRGYEPRVERAVDGRGEIQDRKAVRIVEKRAGRAVFTGDVRLVPDKLTEPLKWKKPAMVFVNSMSDLFHESVPFDYVDQVMAVIALCPQHTFQALTKRPERMAEYLNDITLNNRVGMEMAKISDAADRARIKHEHPGWFFERPPQRAMPPIRNLWLGTSVENQAAADERIPHLLKCPAAVRFLSVEPLLGEVELVSVADDGLNSINALTGNRLVEGQCRDGAAVDWVIVGGESGAKARPCNVAWIRSVVQQCKTDGVPVFVKQLGARPCIQMKDYTDTVTYERGGGFWPASGYAKENAWITRVKDAKGSNMAEWPEDLRVREWPRGCVAPSGLEA